MMNDVKWKVAAAALAGLLICTLAERAEAQIVPTVVSVPASTPPAVPSGLKVTCLQGPNVLASSATCPVVRWYGYTYWAFSYIDNRVSMGIVAYDPAGNVVAQWEKPGSRYVYAIAVDPAARSVTFAGQADARITMKWSELTPPPTVAQVPANTPPAIPPGMKVTCLQGPNVLVSSATCPVVRWLGYTYWAFSYIDNRVSMGIAAYDPAGNLVAQWEKPGSRYVYAISVSPATQTVIFAGQVDAQVAMTWAELVPAPVVASVPASAPPPVPAGMKVTCLQGPDVLTSSANCPVVRWGGYTYWAFSYLDNRVAMGIVAYDAAGNVAAQWEKPGSRYVYAIGVAPAARSVTFAGQASAKITMPWAELLSQP